MSNIVKLVCYNNLINKSLKQLYDGHKTTLQILKSGKGWETNVTIPQFELVCPNLSIDAVTTKDKTDRKIWNDEWIRTATLVLTNAGKNLDGSLNDDGTAKNEYDWFWIQILKTYKSEVVAQKQSLRGKTSMFYIEDVVEKATAYDKETGSFVAAYNSLQELGPEEMVLFASVLGFNTRMISMIEIKERLIQYLRQGTKNVNAFNEYLLDRERLSLESVLKRGYEYHILSFVNGGYTFNEVFLGGNLNEAVSYLRELKNQPLRFSIESKLKEAISTTTTM